jgi:hypothetical protein
MKKTRLRLLASCALALLAGGRALAQETVPPPPAPAPVGWSVPPEGRFGRPGQYAVSGALSTSLIRVTMSGKGSTTFSIQPAFDYFIAPNVSLGTVAGFAFSSADNASSNQLQIQARVGWNITLAETVSLWARAAVGFAHASSSMTQNGMNSSATSSSIPVTLFVPLLWEPAPHLFLGFGPVFTTQFLSKMQGNSIDPITQYGAQSVVGGYFGGR